MRRALIVTLTVMAAIAPAVRLACAKTCVQPVKAEPAHCHGDAASTPDDTPAAPDGGNCRHDHAITQKPIARVAVDPPMLAGTVLFSWSAARSAAAPLTRGDAAIPRGSPPTPLLPLRI